MLAGLSTWACLGDSITEDPEGYVSICRARLVEKFGQASPKVVNAGISGNRSTDMLARFERDVLSHQPDLVSISVGVNDVWHGYFDFESETPLPHFDPSRGVDLDTYIESLDRMIGMARGAKVLLVAPTPIHDDPDNRENRLLSAYVDAMEELATEHQCLYCPMNDLFWETLHSGRQADPGFPLTWDGVHMNPAGVRMMAVGVLNSLGFFAP